MQRIVLFAQHPAAVGAAVGGRQRRAGQDERLVVPVPVEGERLAADRTGGGQPVEEGGRAADRGVQERAGRAVLAQMQRPAALAQRQRPGERGERAERQRAVEPAAVVGGGEGRLGGVRTVFEDQLRGVRRGVRQPTGHQQGAVRPPDGPVQERLRGAVVQDEIPGGGGRDDQLTAVRERIRDRREPRCAGDAVGGAVGQDQLGGPGLGVCGGIARGAPSRVGRAAARASRRIRTVRRRGRAGAASGTAGPPSAALSSPPGSTGKDTTVPVPRWVSRSAAGGGPGAVTVRSRAPAAAAWCPASRRAGRPTLSSSFPSAYRGVIRTPPPAS